MKKPTLSTVAAALGTFSNNPKPKTAAEVVEDVRSGIEMLKSQNPVTNTVDSATQHARLPTDKLKKNGFGKSAHAAEAVANLGGSPRAQIDAARAHAPGTRLNYLPHQGAKEIARRKAKMERLAARERNES